MSKIGTAIRAKQSEQKPNWQIKSVSLVDPLASYEPLKMAINAEISKKSTVPLSSQSASA